MDSSGSGGVLCVARAFIDPNTHKVLGVARADVNLSLFTNDLSRISLEHKGKLFIVYNNHIVNTWNDSYINSFINEQEFLDAVYSDADAPQMTSVNGTRHIINTSRLKDTPIMLVYAASYKDTIADTTLVGTSVLVTGLVSLIGAVLIMFLITGWLTAPITRLMSYMRSFNGGWTKMPEDMMSNDEMGELCKTYNSMLDTIDSLITDVETLYKNQKMLELKALQAQINPHFLYNTLDSINWMARAHHARDISSMVSALGTFFRHSLNKGNEYTTIENELKQIKSYTDIQKIRYSDKFRMEYDLSLIHI